jgi:hypothetical protein
VWKLLIYLRGAPSRFFLQDHVFEWSLEAPSVHKGLVEFLRWHGTKADGYFFSKWKDIRADLSVEEVKQLFQSFDIWVRAEAYALWPDKCPKGLKADVLRELELIRQEVERAGPDMQREQGLNSPLPVSTNVPVMALVAILALAASILFTRDSVRRRLGWIVGRGSH